MYNNASYRRYNVSGTTNFTFAQVGATVRMTPAIYAWTGATINPAEPDPGNDGRAFLAFKVTNPSAGVWHYEYALYNQNLDRAIQSFSVPLGCTIPLSNLGFHAPLNHPGFPNDGTQGDAGFSNAPWTSSQTTGAVTWSTETLHRTRTRTPFAGAHSITSVSILISRPWRPMRRSASSKQALPSPSPSWVPMHATGRRRRRRQPHLARAHG